jgi:hypothetical protein
MEVKFVAFQLLLWAQEAETFQLRTRSLKKMIFFLNSTKNVKNAFAYCKILSPGQVYTAKDDINNNGNSTFLKQKK